MIDGTASTRRVIPVSRARRDIFEAFRPASELLFEQVVERDSLSLQRLEGDPVLRQEFVAAASSSVKARPRDEQRWGTPK